MGPDIFNIIALSAGLGADAMGVSLGMGVVWHGARQKFRLAWHMGLFQGLMVLGGFHAGRKLAAFLSYMGSYLAAGLLLAIGVKMLYEALKHSGVPVGQKPAGAKADPTRGWSLVGLSLATSIDALVAGFSLGIRGPAAIWMVSVIVGVTAGLMALTGVIIGKRIGGAFSKWAEIFGAAVILALGISFLF